MYPRRHKQYTLSITHPFPNEMHQSREVEHPKKTLNNKLQNANNNRQSTRITTRMSIDAASMRNSYFS